MNEHHHPFLRIPTPRLSSGPRFVTEYLLSSTQEQSSLRRPSGCLQVQSWEERLPHHSLEEDHSEIYTLKGMIAQARLQVDPMNRWMKYGAESISNFKNAIKLDTLNPRPEYLMGIGLYYTPEQFGGGPETAKPLLEKSLAKFNEFVPENDLVPNWGREMVEQLLEQIKETPVGESSKTK